MLHIMAVVRLLMEASKGNWNPNLLGGGGQGSSKIPNSEISGTIKRDSHRKGEVECFR